MASWDPEIKTPAQQRELKRRAILRVAAELFNEKGFHGTSLDEIADVLGVTKTALYYYVKSKDVLLYECLMVSYDCGQDARNHAEKHGSNPLEKIELLYRRFVELLMTERGAYTTMANLNALPEPKRKQLMARRRQLDKYSRDLLQQAANAGLIREIDPKIGSNYFLGAANWILRWYQEGEKSPEEIADIFLDLLLNGISKSAPAKRK